MARSFCSWTCLFKSFFSAVAVLFKLPKRTSGRRGKFRAHLAANGANYFTWFFIAVVIAVPALLLVGHHQQAPPQKTVEAKSDGSTVVWSDARAEISGMRINGNAADSLIIAVKVNGRMAAVGLAQEGAFLFDNVPLELGENEIEVFALDTDGRAQVLQRMTARYGTPVPMLLARNVVRGSINRRRIALTFDGGSGAARAEEILDILKQHGLACSMFLTGGFIRRYPQLVSRMVQDGHEIGNHTWSHPHLTTFETDRSHATKQGVSREFLQPELIKTAELFTKITGKKMAPLWRAPFGEHNQEIRRWAAELGYLHVGWTSGGGETMDTLDWVTDSTAAGYRPGDEILRRLLNFGQNDASGANGGIILMHLDTQRQTDPVFKILPALIDSMRGRGYEFTTVSEIIRP